ncbi:unnamed protein product [Timema podura]|uniref:Kelch-like protein 10 n=1 Tax=Timema podura TaxID=61482 RepID=A0ABN7NDY7_TIMPD|nr:unnamed protein product [Timema podura]
MTRTTDKMHIVDLMKNIRLGLLETQYFLEHVDKKCPTGVRELQVKDHPYVTNNEACRPVIIETLKFLYDLEMITQKDGEVPTPEIARPRVPHEILFAIGGWSGGSPTNFMETYDTRADRWVKEKKTFQTFHIPYLPYVFSPSYHQVEEVDPTGPRAYHGTAVVVNSIYVIGGFDGMDYFNSCRCFNAVLKKWREVAPMNARRCYVSVSVHNDLIYAMGGYDGHHRQNTAERYNFKTNQWSLIAPMNMQRSDACATTLNDRIYITGGFNGQECMNSAEAYDPETNQWTLITPMRSRRSGVSTITYHGCVYVLGGFNGISRMCSGEKFNPATNSWTSVPDMYNPRSNFAIEVIDDMVFAIGGFNGVTTIYHVECFDEKTGEWQGSPIIFEGVPFEKLSILPRSCKTLTLFYYFIIADLPCLLPAHHRISIISSVYRYLIKFLKNVSAVRNLVTLGLRYEATDMNIYRSALSACVIMGLPNVHDYIHKHRERLMEEKRLKLRALEYQRNGEANVDQFNNHNVINGVNNPDEIIEININNNNNVNLNNAIQDVNHNANMNIALVDIDNIDNAFPYNVNMNNDAQDDDDDNVNMNDVLLDVDHNVDLNNAIMDVNRNVNHNINMNNDTHDVD